MDTRDNKGRFTKGNPGGGRPKKQPTTADLLQTLSPQAVTCLEDLMHSNDEDIALKASVAILEIALKCEQDRKKFSIDDKKSIEEEVRELQEHFAKFGLYFSYDIVPFSMVRETVKSPILD